MLNMNRYTRENLLSKIPEVVEIAKKSESVDDFRRELSNHAHRMEYETFHDYSSFTEGSIIRVRDCARVVQMIVTKRSEDRAQFSAAEALRDIILGTPRPDLSPAFYAEMLYLFQGLAGRGPGNQLADSHLSTSPLEGREAAIERSQQLDTLSREVEKYADKCPSGLGKEAIQRRERRRERILAGLGASHEQWYDWRWQYENIMRDAEVIAELVELSPQEREAIANARKARIPFGITPHYLSLMDDEPGSTRDRAVRAQVIPPLDYVEHMKSYGNQGNPCLDFMRESDTSPIDLVTRRYPSICIFKPFNTCPQICVYCQRNWEIDDAMAPGALAPEEDIAAALKWIQEHPAIHEVLITGGDPLAMTDDQFARVLQGVSQIPSVERIRIGSRTPVTAPMRITEKLADLLAGQREPGKRQVALVTHIQHPYELTPETAAAIERLRIRGISVFNQLVYTFYVSRRFEAVSLRRNLAQVGVEPYYTFNTKGKEETIEYRVPIARLLQEQKEEARLLPGISRTDEAVYNVPGMGKNYLRAYHHRDLIAILPDGSRLYEFHPWEKNISGFTSTFASEDVPILDYLIRLDGVGEDVSDYETIWYYH